MTTENVLLTTTNLPWVEKYRPQTLQEIVSQHDIISTLTRFSDKGQLPHLLLHGPPGTGKTSTVQAIGRQLYGPNFKQMVLELNASDDRGIAVVRDIIKVFAETTPHLSSYNNTSISDDDKTSFQMKTRLKLIILDEADQMTGAAQMALRRIIENFAQYVRFFIICNYVNKINPALQSRCTKFRFPPLDPLDIAKRVEFICEIEGVRITDDGLKALIHISKGDMRKVLNSLQSAAMSNEAKTIDANAILETVGFPLPAHIDYIMPKLNNDSFQEAYTALKAIISSRGYSLLDFTTCVYERLLLLDLPIQIVCVALPRLADIEYRLALGADDCTQLAALIALFIELRDILVQLKQKSI